MYENPPVDVIVLFSDTRSVLIFPSIHLLPTSHRETPLTHQIVLSHQRGLNTSFVCSTNRAAITELERLSDRLFRSPYLLFLFGYCSDVYS